MRLAVFADIHGNMIALDTALKEIKNDSVDGFIVAGDMLAGPNPVEVIHRLLELDAWMIRGNNENYIVQFAAGNAPGWWYSAHQWSFMHWNYRKLDKETLDVIKSLPEQRTISIAGFDPIHVVHGSPRDISELVYPDKDISLLDNAVKEVKEPVLVFGHTHEPWQIHRNGSLAFNPGSLSATLMGKTGGSYAILSWDEDKWNVELRELIYDIPLARKAFEASGLLDEGGAIAERWLHDIESGRNTMPRFVEYAYKRAADAGYPDSPFVPDDIWDEAVRSFDEQNDMDKP